MRQLKKKMTTRLKCKPCPFGNVLSVSVDLIITLRLGKSDFFVAGNYCARLSRTSATRCLLSLSIAHFGRQPASRLVQVIPILNPMSISDARVRFIKEFPLSELTIAVVWKPGFRPIFSSIPTTPFHQQFLSEASSRMTADFTTLLLLLYFAL